MFHAEFLIEDKDLVRLHYQLASLRVFNLDVKPVVNAKKKNGKIVEEHPGGGTIKQRLAAAIQANYSPEDKFSRADIFDLAREVGGSPSSAQVVHLVADKIIRKKARNLYQLVATK